MAKAQAQDKRRSVATFEPAGFVLVEKHALRDAQDGDHKEVSRPLGAAVCCPCACRGAGIHAGLTYRMEMAPDC